MSVPGSRSLPGVLQPHGEAGKLFIAGSWLNSKGGGRRDVLNPATGQIIGTVAAATPQDVDKAVLAAQTSFESDPWPRMTGRERSRILLRIADIMRQRADDLVVAESLDVGKPITLCRSVDVQTSADQYEYYAALAQSIDGAVRRIPYPVHSYTQREPLGVVAAITPFNFPLVLSSSKIAPALAAGNTVVHKPAEDTPLSALVMADIFTEAGVPAGVVNVVTGSGPIVGEALICHPGVAKIAFTGSTEVGRHIAAVAGKNLKPVTVELGGNGANILFEDADLEKAINSIIKGFVFNSGQFCMSGARLLVADACYDSVIDLLHNAVPNVLVGDPFSEQTTVGPLAGERQRQRVEQYLEIALADRGNVLTGGSRLDINGGFYFQPTVITDLPAKSTVIQDEVFGPVLTVQRFRDETEAITLANSTPYGLAAGLHTQNVARAHRVAAMLQAGIIWVNEWAVLDPAIPFGGVKQSGFGREYGPESLEAYTTTKSVVVSLN